eukprot:m.1248712 g.1248712  ORF g.1248712 m.1248712 type:complete len:323 (+) comp24698_c1_seq8:662-1630(+)
MHNQKAYVACQGPMPNIRGTADFWRMVWQIKSTAIIMVTGITEGGVEKCARYWPAELYNPTKKLGEQTYDKIKVRVTAGFRKDGFITSCLQVQRGTEPPREIRHYWYDSWPDHGVPDRVEPIISMIKAARAFTGGYDTPWVVHCSAGIGRSGTVIAVDSGMHALLHTGKANVVSIIKNMREGRGGLVQHPEQAKFVHLCLSRYIESHGSVNELAVLEDSIKKAEAAVPEVSRKHRVFLDQRACRRCRKVDVVSARACTAKVTGDGCAGLHRMRQRTFLRCLRTTGCSQSLHARLHSTVSHTSHCSAALCIEERCLMHCWRTL